MAKDFSAELIVHTECEATRLQITFADARGNEQILSLSPAIAACLAEVLKDFARTPQPGGKTATKIPQQFSVGSGRYERVVLVRFEDDVPYGLNPRQAAELGQALVEEALSVTREPALVRQ